LEEFRILLASNRAQIFDIQVQGLEIQKKNIFLFLFHSGIKANVLQAPEKTSVILKLSDLRIYDPYKEARYRKV